MASSNEGDGVSVIGLGNMGAALVRSLLARGHSVIAWNRTSEKGEALALAGARIAKTLSKAATRVTVLCVTDHRAASSLLEDEGFAQALHGKLLVQLSTVTREESRALATWARERGIDYLDGSIFSYPADIAAGNGTILYSGPKELFTANERQLTGMGGKPRFLSEEIGAAPVLDKALYAFHYCSLIGFLHGAAISYAARIPISTYLEQSLMVAAGTATKERMAGMIEARRYETDAASISIELNAYEHVLNLSEALGIESDLPGLIAAIMRQATARGYAEQDLAAVFEVLLDPGNKSESEE